jgi:hypothetical protein
MAKWVAKAYDSEQVAVERTQPGNTLAIPSEGGLPPRFFRVTSKHVDRESGEPPLIVLESDPLPGESQPWVLTYPIGTSVARIVSYREQ